MKTCMPCIYTCTDRPPEFLSSNDVKYKYNYTPGDAIQNALLLNEEQAKAPKELLESVGREFTMEKFLELHCVSKKYELKMQMADTVI